MDNNTTDITPVDETASEPSFAREVAVDVAKSAAAVLITNAVVLGGLYVTAKLADKIQKRRAAKQVTAEVVEPTETTQQD